MGTHAKLVETDEIKAARKAATDKQQDRAKKLVEQFISGEKEPSLGGAVYALAKIHDTKKKMMELSKLINGLNAELKQRQHESIMLQGAAMQLLEDLEHWAVEELESQDDR